MAKKKTEFLGFFKEYKLHKACADDLLRPAMQYVAFKDGYAYATNAFVAIKANLRNVSALSFEDIQKLNGYAIHKDQYAELLKFNEIEVRDGSIVAKGATENAQTIFTLAKIVENSNDKRPGAIRFPDVEALIARDTERCELEGIGINLKLLNNAAAAMGVEGGNIGLLFTAAAGKIFIKSDRLADVRGIIMPVVMN